MKKISILLALVISMAAEAQVSKVSLQASGLTCSMCSNAIYKALKTLAFVDKVDADVKNYTFEITFKPKANIDFDKIRKKVEDAGFSVSRFIAFIRFDNVKLQGNDLVTTGDYTFSFVNGNEQSLNGIHPIQLLDKGFVSPKEYKRTGMSEAQGNARVYRVSL